MFVMRNIQQRTVENEKNIIKFRGTHRNHEYIFVTWLCAMKVCFFYFYFIQVYE